MHKICIMTGTRAEYGLLKPLIDKLSGQKDIDLRVVVTGSHLSAEFGMTVDEIVRDGVNVDKRIDINIRGDSPLSISKSMGFAMIGFGEYFAERRPDILILLGDRYEALAVASTALSFLIPIAHIHGGELTLGAIDDSMRHSITKMSHLHFTSTEEYRRRVIQLGEDPSRVYNVGSLGVENIKSIELLSREEISQDVGLNPYAEYAVVTFHPATMEEDSSEIQIKELLGAIDQFGEMEFVITKANADHGGSRINKLLEKYTQSKDNCVLVSSLGYRRYLSAVKYSSMVIGNSSSGIIEAPSFKIPTINIGDRQKGRIQAQSVINCQPTQNSIKDAISKAKSKDFLQKVIETSNPYEGHKTSLEIASRITDFVIEYERLGKSYPVKPFCDII